MQEVLEPCVQAAATVDHQMSAIVQDRYGSADVLRFDQIDQPAITADEVLIEVHAAGVDRGVWHLMTGEPYLVRLAGYGVRKPKNPVLGLDVAGRIVAVGSNVTRLKRGDEVFGIGQGSYAQFVAADQDKVALKPANMTFEQAAVAPVSGTTALQALTDVGQIEPGQHVLIIGASGGVGSFAIQLAKANGALVTGIGGPKSLDLMRSLGADHVIDYTTQDFVDTTVRYDLILDIGGRNRVSRIRSVLKPTGTLVIVGGENGNKVTGGVGRQIRAMLLSPFVKQRLTMFIATEHYSFIERLAVHMRKGEVTPEIGRRYELANVPSAMRDLAQDASSGKAVIVVRGEAVEPVTLG